MISRNPANPAAAEHMRIVEEELRRRPPEPICPVYPDASSEYVMLQVCKVCGCELDELLGNERHREAVQSRQVATICLREICGMSFPEIATTMGKLGVNRTGGHTASLDRCTRPRSPETKALIREVRDRVRTAIAEEAKKAAAANGDVKCST